MKTTQRSKYFYGVQSLGTIADQNKINQSIKQTKKILESLIFFLEM